ncbi:hypothetical protein GCM10023149_53270 [Mucilaginibacter gynuensis]|uniref:Cytochrome c domain-containing protein n=1 Tax=Mucilaginibacter gynuensis TaxID=1302236 RepID=A0ABP8HMJ0_9SPHI
MKKLLTIPAFLMVLILTAPAVNTAYAQQKKATNKAPAKKAGGAADIAAGQALLSKSDCLTCHKLDVKIVGPAYKDVASRYPATDANIAMLAKKVIDGGSGAWGQIPMSPHPNVTPADAKKMVKYILSVK